MSKILAPVGTHIRVHDATNRDYEGTIDPLTDETWLILKNGSESPVAIRKHYIVSWRKA